MSDLLIDVSSFKKSVIKDVLEKVSYVSEDILGVQLNDDELVLRCHQDSNADQLKKDIDKLIQSISLSFEKVDDVTLESFDGVIDFDRDPELLFIEAGDLFYGVPGVPTYSERLAKAILQVDDHFKNYALALGSKEEFYPATVPVVDLIQSDYVGNFPHHCLLVGNIRHSWDSLGEVAKNKAKYIEQKNLDGLVANCSQVLAPTVCCHTFLKRKESQLDTENTVVTASNLCHRHEGSGHAGMRRLQTYRMREIIYFGSKDFVLENHEKHLNKLAEWLKKLEVRHRICVASDPFFASGNEMKRPFQAMLKLKYEVQCYLPFLDDWISVCSSNNHQQSLVNAYSISKTNGSKDLFSGCFGVGLDRLVYAIASQKGDEFLYDLNWKELDG